MKELVYTTIDGKNPRKKEVSIEEKQDSLKTHIYKIWKCKYFLKSKYHSRSKEDVERWLNSHQKIGSSVKNCHILKEKNSITGRSKVICKVYGEFFVVNGFSILTIAYVNSLKILIENKKKG